MKVLLLCSGGLQRCALLLAVSPDRMRVLMPAMADAVEFRLMDGIWVSESGGAVEIAAARLPDAPEDGWLEERIPHRLLPLMV